MARASVVVVCSEACAIEQSPLGGACDSTGVDPATGECVLGLAQSDSDLPGHFMAQKFRI